MAETERGARRRERGVERRIFNVVVVVVAVVEGFEREREDGGTSSLIESERKKSRIKTKSSFYKRDRCSF